MCLVVFKEPVQDPYDVIDIAEVVEREWEMLEDLKTAVTNKLVTEHEFLIEEAETVVEGSMDENPDMWNENADANDLANYLASDDD